MSNYPLGPRIVKPSVPREWFLNIVAVAPEGVALERTGMVESRDRLSMVVAQEERSLFIVQNADRMALELTETFGSDPDWNYHLKPIHPKGNGPRGGRITSTVVKQFGWRSHKRGGRYHLVIDPFVFTSTRLSELVPDHVGELAKLSLWGRLLRDWLVTQNLPPAASAGAVGAALLRSPLWHTSTRKVPRATNARLRPFLPGNHHRLYTDTGQTHHAVKLDMSGAHHQVAATTPLPSPNTFVLRGHRPFIGTDGTEGTGTPWCYPRSRRYRELLDRHHGFIYAHVTVPHVGAGAIIHPALEVAGPQDMGIWTTALPHLQAAGVIVEWIYWCITSPEVDTTMSEYARFALRTIAQTSDALKPTVKRILLSAYGVKASVPSRMERGVRLSDRGEPGAYPVAGGVLPVRRLRLDVEVEPLVAHVAHRAMIEEGLRVAVVEQAQALQALGHRVLCIYADAVIVEADGQTLPFLPPPWKSAEPLTAVKFLTDNGTAYRAVEESRLPGIPRIGRETVPDVGPADRRKRLDWAMRGL